MSKQPNGQRTHNLHLLCEPASRQLTIISPGLSLASLLHKHHEHTYASIEFHCASCGYMYIQVTTTHHNYYLHAKLKGVVSKTHGESIYSTRECIVEWECIETVHRTLQWDLSICCMQAQMFSNMQTFTIGKISQHTNCI